MGVFSIFRDKSASSAPESGKIPTQEAYYGTIVRRISLAKYVLILISICFAAFAFTFFGDELTIENFRYMLKFVSFDPVTVSMDGAEIKYDYDAGNTGAIVRGDLAVVNGSEICVYDFSSRRVLKSHLGYSDPLVRVSDRNIYVCDLGGTELEIFTSYSSVFSQSYEYPILGLDVNGSGAFAVISKKKNYRSGIWVYDENFNTVYTTFFGSDREIIDVSLNDDGTRLMAAAFYTTDAGEFETYLMTIDTGSEDPVRTVTVPGELPWKVCYTDDGGCWLLTDRALRRYSADGAEIFCEYYGSRTIKKFKLDEKYASLAYHDGSSGNDMYVEFYSSSGLTGTAYVPAVTDILFYGDRAYMLTSNGLDIVDPTDTGCTPLHVADGVFDSVLVSRETSQIVLFSKSRAVIYDIDGLTGD